MGHKRMWKKALAIALAMILAFSGIHMGVSPMVVRAESTNLLVDGDLGDDAEDDLWNGGIWKFSDETWALVPSANGIGYNEWADVNDSGSGLGIPYIADGTVELYQVVASLEAGDYTLTGYVKDTNGKTGSVQVYVGDKGNVAGEATAISTEFTQFSYKFKLDSAMTNCAVGFLVTSQTDAWVCLDSLVLTKDAEIVSGGDKTEDDGEDSGSTGDEVVTVTKLWDDVAVSMNGDFEASADAASGWSVSADGLDAKVNTDEWAKVNTTKVFHIANNGSEAKAFSMSQTLSGLEAGTYKLVMEQSGMEAASGLSVNVGGVTTALPATTGWDVWTTVETEAFTLAQAGDVTITISGDMVAKYWGDLDNIVLKKQNVVVTNGDFEASADEASGWSVSADGLDAKVNTDEWAKVNTTKVFHIANNGSEAKAFSMTQTIKNLDAGTYALKLEQSGEKVASGLSVSVGGTTKVLPAATGWDVWTTVETDAFTLAESGDVTITISGDVVAGYWGDIDNIVICEPSALAGDDSTDDDNTGDGGTGDDVVVDTTPAKDVKIHVDPVEGITDDFIGGMDISSYLVLKENGVKFYDYDGNELDNQGWFNFLKECGVNYVRIRVWNDPYDAEGHGYGGGNNDLAKAIEMGQYATKAGIRVLVDFHYSDTWADPGRQLVPKAWASMNTEETIAAIKEFTTDSLTKLKDAGVDVGMVQVGNETTTAFVGAGAGTDTYYAYLQAGCEAVRAVDKNILIALHFTNPENGKYSKTAKGLQDAGVDYDVFASSYYPMWHGTLENLTNELKLVRENYGKKVLVAETSWPYTSEDGDGCANSAGAVGVDDAFYDLTVHGQAGAIRKVIEATVKAGGIGVFYWEPAWLPVNVIDWSNSEEANALYAKNETAWKEGGAGWASDYAGSYDPEVAEWGGGGAVIDNQAMFDFWGYPLQSLSIFKYAKEGLQGEVTMSVVMPTSYKYVSGVDEFAMPSTVQVRYTDQNYRDCAVIWDDAQIENAMATGTGIYTIDGTVTIDGATYKTTCELEIQMINWLSNPGLEEADTSMWVIDNGASASVGKENFRNGNYAIRFWDDADFSFTATQDVTLDAGYYVFGGFLMGDGSGEYKYTVKNGEEVLEASAALNGWDKWNMYEVAEFCVTKDNTTVTVGVSVNGGAGAWGGFDDFYVYKTGSFEASPVPPVVDTPESSSPTVNTSGSASINWNEVQTQVQSNISAAATKTESVNLNFTSAGETKVPTTVLSSIKGSNVTVAFQSGSGVALSVSGQNLKDVDVAKLQEIDLTVTKEPNVIPDAAVASKEAIAKRELSVKDTGSFGITVDLHVNVGRENAGKVANLYRYNHSTGKLEYCGNFIVTENGQSMFPIDRGGDYLITVTNTAVNEIVMYHGKEYIVKAGDSLSKIARRYQMTLGELLRRNPQVKNPNRIHVGERINVK